MILTDIYGGSDLYLSVRPVQWRARPRSQRMLLKSLSWRGWNSRLRRKSWFQWIHSWCTRLAYAKTQSQCPRPTVQQYQRISCSGREKMQCLKSQLIQHIYLLDDRPMEDIHHHHRHCIDRQPLSVKRMFLCLPSQNGLLIVSCTHACVPHRSIPPTSASLSNYLRFDRQES